MKNLTSMILSLLLFISITFLSCSDNTTDPEEQIIKNYFPNTEGSLYKYDLEITDSLGTSFTAERTSTYNGSAVFNSKSFQIMVDNYVFPQYSFTDSSYFRKSDNNVFYYADVSQAMQIVPDSLKSLIQADDEAKLFSFPINVGDSSVVYKLAINYSGFLMNIVYVSSKALNKENVSLTVNGGAFNKEAVKIRFTMSVIVEFPMLVSYVAEAWLVEDVGLVKLEGDSEAINFMVGNNLFYPNGFVKQTLKQYSIP